MDELNIQIGRKEPEPASQDSLRPDHTEKYSSVFINGFSKTAEKKDIYDILLEGVFQLTVKLRTLRKMIKKNSLS